MLNPYLFYQDTCEAAFNFYAKVLGGKIDAMMRVSDAPPDMPAAPGREKTIMHARMSLPGGSVLMASDAPPEHVQKPQGLSISPTSRTPSVSLTRSPTVAPSPCRSARRSGPRGLACASTSSASPGW
ncbi:putative glyoxalase superfamily protein PhnB [Bradyrhizobium diazoefficiens]